MQQMQRRGDCEKAPPAPPAMPATPPVKRPSSVHRCLWILLRLAMVLIAVTSLWLRFYYDTSKYHKHGESAAVLNETSSGGRRWTAKEAQQWYQSQRQQQLLVSGEAERLLKNRRPVWTTVRANEWYDNQGWLVGSDYIPAYASNQLEMFQAETFNLTAISRELDLAREIGMTTMRVFLHDLLYDSDPEAFFAHLDAFLDVCSLKGIRPILVFFDSCWDPYPKVGPQLAPRPRVHNSRWVQSPGRNPLGDIAEYRRLQDYVTAVVTRYKDDHRILMWDVWNEPDNNIGDRWWTVLRMLADVFDWVRAVGPSQPVTAGAWTGDWSNEFTKLIIALSDIVTFHTYGDPSSLKATVSYLRRFNRPLICTEWLARGQGSTVRGILPIMKSERVGAINWGFVSGKTNTIYPWDSWDRPYHDEPNPWHHDLFRGNLTPYSQDEYNIFRQLTGKK